MLQKAQMKSTILKYLTRSKTPSVKVRNLTSQAFVQPYLQMIHAVWLHLPISSIEKIEAKNRQLSRVTHNCWDANNEEVRWLPNYETAESKAQCFVRRSIDESGTISSGLFEKYILGKVILMYLRMHIEEQPYIHALPRERFIHYVNDWINPSIEDQRRCYLDRLSTLLTSASSEIYRLVDLSRAFINPALLNSFKHVSLSPVSPCPTRMMDNVLRMRCKISLFPYAVENRRIQLNISSSNGLNVYSFSLR